MKQFVILFTILSFIIDSIAIPAKYVWADTTNPVNPKITLSPAFNPVVIRGLQYYPEDPLKFNFIIDSGDASLNATTLQDEAQRLIKYFLASLTVPENDLWVNLSPDEKDRIIPEKFGTTEMGVTLLAQDYILKQLSSSLINPDDKLGKHFWSGIYQRIAEKFGTIDIPIQTFNRVWIVPDAAKIYHEENKVFVAQAHFKVMLDEDYRHKSLQEKPETRIVLDATRNILIPALEREVNEGKNFGPLRQIFHSLILAVWYKKHLNDTFLGKNYAGQNKVSGVETGDLSQKNRIYLEYVQSFQKGIYNIIKEEEDPLTKETIPKKYFSGGINATNLITNLGEVSSPLEIEQKGRTYSILTYFGLNRGRQSRLMAAALSASLAFHFLILSVGTLPSQKILTAPVLEVTLVKPRDFPKSSTEENNTGRQSPVKPQTPLGFYKDGTPVRTDASGYIFSQGKPNIAPKNPFGLSKDELKKLKGPGLVTIGPDGKPKVVPTGIGDMGRIVKGNFDPKDPYWQQAESRFGELVPGRNNPGLGQSPPGYIGQSLPLQNIQIPEGQDFALAAVRGLSDTYEAAFTDTGAHGRAINRIGIYKEHPQRRGEVLTTAETEELMTNRDYLDNDNFGQQKASLFPADNLTSEDVVGFLNQALQKQIPLTSEEKDFVEALIRKGIIRWDGEKYTTPAKINILTHSQDVSSGDEETMRRHELGHALFENDPVYRAKIKSVWDSLTDEQRTILTKYFNIKYQPDSHLREFAEYPTDPRLFIESLINLFEISHHYSPGSNFPPEIREAAFEVVSRIFEDRQTSTGKSAFHGGGIYFTDRAKELLKVIIPSLTQAKWEAMVRAKIASPRASLPSVNMAFLDSNIIPNQGPGYGSYQDETKTIAYVGNESDIITAITQNPKLNSADKAKAAVAFDQYITSHGFKPSDHFQATFEDDVWNFDLVRRAGEISLQQAAQTALDSLSTEDRPNILKVLEAIQKALPQRQLGNLEILSISRDVNVGGEALQLEIKIQHGKSEIRINGQVKQGPGQWQVQVRLNNAKRPQEWSGQIYVSDRNEHLGTALSQATERIKSEVADKGFITLQPAGTTKIFDLDEIVSDWSQFLKLQTQDQRIDVIRQVAFQGQILDLRLIQIRDSKTGTYDTRLGIENDGRVFNGLGVRVESQTRVDGIEKARSQLKDRFQKSPPPQGKASSTTAIMPPGGIDLNPQKWSLQETEPAFSSSPLFDPATKEIMPFTGITPMIIETIPVNLSNFIGLSSTKTQTQTEVANLN